MKREVSIAAGVVLLLVASWLGASIYVGKRTEAELQNAVKASTLSRSYRLRNLNHQGGLFSSSGQVELAMVDACARGEQPSEWFTAQVSYQLSHLIGPMSLLRAEWSVTPTGDAKAAFEKLFNGQAKLEGKGRLRLSGALESDLNLPAMSAITDGETMTVSPSTGSIALGKDKMDFDWKTSKIAYRGNGWAMEIEGFGMKSDLVSVSRGLGSFSMEAAKFGNSSLSAEGLKLAMDVNEKGDRLDMRLTPSVKMMSVSGKQFEDLLLEMAVTGMHAKSVEQLIELSDKSCYFRSLTMEESSQMRASLRKLVFEGLSAGIPKLTGKLDGGALNGSLMVGFGKTTGDSFELEKVLTSRGELSLTGKNMKAEDTKSLVTMGFATTIPDGIKSSFDYEAGILKVNGKVFDATLFGNVLKGANVAINGLLSDKPEPRMSVVLPEPEADVDEAPDADVQPTPKATEGA